MAAGLLAALALGGCSSGSDAKPIAELHPPVSTSRAPVLTDPPFALEPLDPQISAARYMTGSPDRLVVLSDYGDEWYIQGEPTLPPAARKLAAFDFRRWRWSALPKPRYDPVALPDGLVAVGLKCGPSEDSNSKCHVEVTTLQWGDARWRHQVVTRRAEWVHEGGSVDLLGVRGRDAYFTAAREAEHRVIVRVRADGTVRRLPKVPWADPRVGPVTEYLPLTCVTPHGLDSLRMRQAEPDRLPTVDPDDVEAGPVFRLDDRRARPRWREVPGTNPIDAPRGAFVCGPDGLVLLHPPETSAWTDTGFTTLATGAPKLPDGGATYLTALPLADGGLVYSDGLYPNRLRDGIWTTLALPRDRLPWTTVGNLVVFQAVNPTTGRTEIHVAP